MPLTLQCYCPGASGISACTLTGLHFEGSGGSDGAYGFTSSLTLLGGAFPYAGSLDPFSVPMSLSDAAVWGSLYVEYEMDASLFQPPDPDKWGVAGYGFWIRQTYTCIDSSTGAVTTKTVLAYNQEAGTVECWTPPPTHVFKWAGQIGPGGAGGFLITSSPLGDCDSGRPTVLTSGNFDPAPLDTKISLDSSSGSVCLCAEGGVEPYHFSIASGALPSGQSLDPTTGCIIGSPDGLSRGSDPITYRVRDAVGDTAEVICSYAPSACANPNDLAVGNAFY